MALTYLKKYEEDIDLKIWNKNINPINIKQKDLNRFLLYYIVHYTDSEYNDTILQYYMKEDFIKQIKETQALANKYIV